MKNLSLSIAMLISIIIATVQISSAQVDSTCNYNYITQQRDAFYDSIISNYGDSALEGTGYKSYKRWRDHMYFRQGSNGDLTAHEQYIQEYFEGTRNISENNGSDWKYFGPKGIPDSYSGANHSPGSNGKGMIISLYVDPDDHDKILAGSHNSGLWKTEDGGETWYCLTDDNYKIRGVNSIVVDPETPSTILISSFNTLSDNSYGLFKSTDGGITWDEMNDGLEFNNNPIYPSNNKRALPRKLLLRQGDSTLFFITHSYVFKAENFNDDWELIYYKIYENWLYEKGFFDLEFDSQNDSILFLSGTHVFKSINNGATWVNITHDVIGDTLAQIPIRTEISICNTYPGKVWFNCLYFDTLSGSNRIKVVRYDPQSSPVYYTYPYIDATYAGVYSMEFEISPDNEDIFYFGDIYLLGYEASNETFAIATPSGGPDNSNWIHVDIREMQIIKYDSTTYRMYLAHDGGISWSELEGNTDSLWTWEYIPGDQEHGLDVFEFYDFTCLDDENDLIYGGCQDLAGMSLKDNVWRQFGCGDGGEIAVDNRNADTTFVYYNSPGAFTGYLYRSIDFGETLDKMFSHTAGSLFTALTLDPFKEKELYYASDKLYHWPNARTGYDPNIISSTNNGNPLTDIEIIHDGNQGQVTNKYISSQRSYGWPDTVPFSNYNSCYWRNYVDKSAYLYGSNYGYITDIETNPNNPCQIWAAFGKATKSSDSLKTKKIYISYDGGGAPDSWVPFVEGFPEGIPVRKLLYDHKYNRLYCASDIGVWVRDLNIPDNQWVEFNHNLPFKIVTDLEILYSQNVIRAATYGRGIWESPIYCYYDAENPYIVEGTEIWTEDRIMSSDIIIPDSARLTITGCKILMPSNAKIIIEKNAKLTLQGAHLSNACDKLWMGIEVWGDPTKDKVQGEQGFVESKGETVIENAWCALYAGKKDSNGYGIKGYGGGILKIQKTTFRNNKRAIELWPYQGADSTTFFKDCCFETTQALLDNHDFEYFIVMNSYSAVKIEGCTFKNTRPATDLSAHYRGTGIKSIESQFSLTKYEDSFATILSSLNGLNYGVKANNITTLGGPEITHCQFDQNITGVYFSGISQAQVTECSFGVDAMDGQYNNYIYCGLYLDNCTGYHIEENDYSNSTFVAQLRPDNVIGITVNNSGGAANEIYRNYFDNLDIGILAQNSNRNAQNTDGLILKCNDFGAADDNHNYDIAVTSWVGWPNSGIFQYQGSNDNEQSPAGNMFSHNPPGNDMSDYYNGTTGIYYYQHIPNPVRLDMEDFSSITINKAQTDMAYDSINSCPSRITKSEAVIRTAISESKTKADSVDLLLNALVDGGNTQALENDVILSTPSEAYTLHNDLMNKSPYLTDTVMIEAVKKEDVLSPVMVKEVLAANPQAAKSEEVMTELENRANPLPDYMVIEIEAGKDSLGGKELMEASKSYFRHQRAINLNMLKSIYKFDTIGLGYSDSLVVLLEDENTVEAKYELAYEHIKRGEYTVASAVLNNIPNQFMLSNDQLRVHQKYDSIMPIIADLYQNYKSVFDLDSLQLDVLNSLVADSNSMLGIYARNILVYTGQLVYNEPYLLPDTSLKAETVEKPLARKENTPPRFKVYPNPAGNYINVEYNLEAEGCDGFVLIRDNLGKTIKAVDVKSEKYSVIISTQELTNGIYLISLVCNEELQATMKVVIQH